MRLLADIGNRNLKWRCGTQSGSFLSDINSLRQNITNEWGGLQDVDSVCAVNVVGDAAENILADCSERQWRIAPEFIRSEPKAGGVTNGYRNYRQLGADRWVCLIGARHCGKLPAIVVDCGTAITVDALDDEGHFVGGSIIAGFALAQNTLSNNASGISEVPRDEVAIPARTTAEAISGTIVATAAGVDELVVRYLDLVGEQATLYLTGGDANLLATHTRHNFQHRADLAFVGMDAYCDQKN